MDLQQSGGNIIKRKLKKISFGQAWNLFRIFIQKPSLFVPTLSASIESLDITQSLFGQKHFGNGPENAYRHTLWAYLIAQKTQNPEWAKYFGTQYEEVFQNQALNKEMDLHNNEVGLNLYKNFPDLSKEELQKKLDLLYQQAQSISQNDPSPEKRSKDQMMFILSSGK